MNIRDQLRKSATTAREWGKIWLANELDEAAALLDDAYLLTCSIRRNARQRIENEVCEEEAGALQTKLVQRR